MHKYFLPFLVFIIYTALRLTWRLRLTEPPELKERLKSRQPFILAHWHGDELVLIQFLGYYRVGTIVSTSKDGDIMNTLVKLIGGTTVRGSSTRGGIGALKGLFRLLKEGWNTSFAVDGPKGPLHQVKPGVFEVARTLGIPIFWSGISCDRAIHFPKSWNKTFLPKPFARVHVTWHGPLWIPAEADPRDAGLAQDLATRLHAAKQQEADSIAALSAGRSSPAP